MQAISQSKKVLIFGAAAVLSAVAFSTNTSSTTKTRSAPTTFVEECDCLPMWTCMQNGGECSKLEKDLRACMAKSRKA
eukprot:TRINITY_DN461_c0_g1_i1.p1 TRINITY_DN461_c0_g1~~TRINITY_DN461_c0_g1_i1.p1  ORF type:complete len:78 (+),score=18.16 TRINITY_DN461_c0_g1_i1:69-302(+)